MTHDPPQLLHSDATPRTLIFVLKFMFAMWFVRFLVDPVERLCELPVLYTLPVGPMGWLPVHVYFAAHTFTGLVVIKSVILAACVGVWIPQTRRSAAVVGCIAIAVISAITRGFGHINHAEISPLLITMVLTGFMLRLPKDQVLFPGNIRCTQSSTALVLSTLCFGLTYSFVGIARIVHGGIELLSGPTIPNSMLRMSHHDWLLPVNLAELLIASPFLLLVLKVGTAAVTVFELFAPFCLISRKFRYAFLALIPLFHLGAILIFKIDFIENVLAMILLLNLTPLLSDLSPSKIVLPFSNPLRRPENSFGFGRD